MADPRSSTPSDREAPTKVCGRCRETFPGDPLDRAAGTVQEWWLCEACRTALLPTSRPSRGAR